MIHFIDFFFRVQVCSSLCKYMCLENKSIFLPLHIIRSPRYSLKFNNEKCNHLHSIGNNLWCNWMCHSIRFYRIFELIWNRALSLISVKKRKNWIHFYTNRHCRKALNVMCIMYVSSNCSTDENRRKTRNENWCTKLPRVFPRGSEFKHGRSITTYILYWRY